MSAKQEVSMSAKRLAWPAFSIAAAGFVLTVWLVSSLGRKNAEVLAAPRLPARQSDDFSLHQLREPRKFREDMRLIPRGQPTPLHIPQP